MKRKLRPISNNGVIIVMGLDGKEMGRFYGGIWLDEAEAEQVRLAPIGLASAWFWLNWHCQTCRETQARMKNWKLTMSEQTDKRGQTFHTFRIDGIYPPWHMTTVNSLNRESWLLTSSNSPDWHIHP